MKKDVTNVINNLYETQDMIIKHATMLVEADIDDLWNINFKDDYSKLKIHQDLITLEGELEQAIRTECTKYVARVIGIVSTEMEISK